jgi:uncharacterized protein
MGTEIIAAVIVFGFTTVLTIAGVGAAFIIIPAFYWLGIPLREAMATALLLNGLSMALASANYIRHRLVLFRLAIPIAAAAVVLSPLGAYSTRYFSRETLLWLFFLFLFFAGSMMLFYQPRLRIRQISRGREIGIGGAVGTTAGYLGGLLGVGGGNFIIPVLIWMGIDPKNASATTAFIVVFSSLAGFLGHTATGQIRLPLLLLSAAGSMGGALLGSWLMQAKLKSVHVKRMVGVALYALGLKIGWDLIVPLIHQWK